MWEEEDGSRGGRKRRCDIAWDGMIWNLHGMAWHLECELKGLDCVRVYVCIKISKCITTTNYMTSENRNVHVHEPEYTLAKDVYVLHGIIIVALKVSLPLSFSNSYFTHSSSAPFSASRNNPFLPAVSQTDDEKPAPRTIIHVTSHRIALHWRRNRSPFPIWGTLSRKHSVLHDRRVSLTTRVVQV
jgi:hypothetical protein